MKLEDPRLEAILGEYRAARRPSAPQREEMLRRLLGSVSKPVLGRVFLLALAASVATLWLAQRLWQDRVEVAARQRATEAGYEVEQTPARGELRAPTPAVAPIATRSAIGPEAAPAIGPETAPLPATAPGRRAKGASVPVRVEPSTPTVTDAAPSIAAPGDAQELAIMAAAEAALRSGDPRGALVSLDEHARVHPRGVAVEEREALRVIATCGLGDAARAGTLRADFLARYVRSAYRKRVERACRP